MKPRWTGATLLAAAFALALLPMTANATPLPAPAPVSPTASATVDQPVFSWQPVDGAASYEIEVALDDQFVTVTDPGDEVAPRVVKGTTYVPTYSYTAKTHYWHVRAVSTDGAKGTWSTTREFTRRWTNDDEAAGVEQMTPGARVDNFRVVGGQAPPINRIGFNWDPVPGASHYEVQFSETPTFQSELTTCLTPHTTLVPYFAVEFSYRAAMTECALNSPFPPPWIPGDWERSEESANELVVFGDGVDPGDMIVVQYFNNNGTLAPGITRQLVLDVHVAEDENDTSWFVIEDLGPSALDVGKLRWYTPKLRFETGKTHYARVRPIDVAESADYPGGEVKGLWSDQRREPGESEPTPLSFTPGPAETGPDTPDEPARPQVTSQQSTDVPLLAWDPVGDADAYRVTVALDRDFTNRVASYLTRSTYLVPDEVYDDNGSHQKYYWFATPCFKPKPDSDYVHCNVAERKAINTNFVATFAKRSERVAGLMTTSTDSQTNTLLRWGDALTAAQTIDPTFTPGGVQSYEVQITTGDWSQATSVITDNLAYSTAAAAPLDSGTYRWRVRPLDGQAVPLAWAYGPGFTIVKPDEPTPSPSQSSTSPNPSTSPTLPGGGSEPTGPAPVYQSPAPADGTAAPLPPEKPGTPVAKRVSKRKVRVHWRASEELGEPVTEYLVYRSTNGNRFAIAKRTTARATKIKARRGKSYWFYVVADSDAGRSDPSTTVKFSK